MDMRRTVTVAGIALALLAGCGGPSEQAGGTVSPSGAATSGSSSSLPPSPPASRPPDSPPPPTTRPVPPPPTGELVTVRGRVEEGVEAGCVVLRADAGTTYLLIGADPAVATPGARVEVEGDLRIDLLTTCQQGTPIAVKKVRRI
jgi:hypothetical protein